MFAEPLAALRRCVGTVPTMPDTDPLDVASRLVADLFPDALAAFLGGSALTSRRTASSDLDILVVANLDAPYRETLRYDGWVVELFVHSPTSLQHYWDKGVADRRAVLLRFCGEGRALVSRDGVATELAAEARRRLLAGPPAPAADVVRWQRYALTDALDDFRDCRDDVEAAFVAAALVTAASELVLLVANAWTGSGKWLPRRVSEVDPQLPLRLVTAQRAALAGDRAPLVELVKDVLERSGGPLTEGLRLVGEAPKAAATTPLPSPGSQRRLT